MFFSVSKQKQTNFPVNYNVKEFWVNLDQGWTLKSFDNCTAIYKGYSDHFDLDKELELVLNQDTPVYLGNFCVIKITDQKLEIKTDKYRSFPLFFEQNRELTNLIRLTHTCWTDSLVSVDSDLNLTETKFDVIGSTELVPNMTAERAIDQIISIVDRKVENLIKHYNKPIKVFLSGGIDTTLVYSFLKKHNADIELIKGQFFEYDYFWLKNSGNVKKFWAYQQLHHYIEPSVLASGAPGDEFMLRSPTTIDLWLKSQSISMLDLLKDQEWAGCLHQQYFSREKHLEIFRTQLLPEGNVIWNICNLLVNDWQHWHLGNTLTWTPLRDLDIIKIILSLPLDQALGQIMNSDLSKQIIERNVPGLSQIISDSKNTDNVLSNLVGLVA